MRRLFLTILFLTLVVVAPAAMGGFLRQGTAVDILIGPFLDEDDGKTAETGLTLAQADIKLSKNGAALAQKNDDTTATHDSDGYYKCELDATDTGTIGQLTVIIHESGALPVRHEYQVVEQAEYDSHYASDASDDGPYTWHVAKNGNNSNGGHSVQDAFLTIAKAVTDSNDGDTIIIHPGTYAEQVLAEGKPRNFIGTHNANCIVNSIKVDDGASIKNLSFSGSLRMAGENVSIENCNIDAGGYGMYPLEAIRGLSIKNCRVKSNKDAFYGYAFDGVSSGVIESSEFYCVDAATTNDHYCGMDIEGNSIWDKCVFECARDDATTVGGAGALGVRVKGNWSWDPAKGRLVFRSCVFRGSQSHADAEGNAIGFAVTGYIEDLQIVFINCTFDGKVTNGDGDARGLVLGDVDVDVACINCSFRSYSENGDATDIIVGAAANLVLTNCIYTTSSGI